MSIARGPLYDSITTTTTKTNDYIHSNNYKEKQKKLLSENLPSIEYKSVDELIKYLHKVN